MASPATNNWWRTDTGLVTVVNPLTSRELWRQAAKQPVWEDWRAAKGAQVVDMVRVVRSRHLRTSAIVLVTLVVACILYLL